MPIHFRAGSLSLLWLLALFSILASACTARAAAEPVAVEPVTVQLVMRDHYYLPGGVRVRAGEPVRLELVNEGQIPHAAMIGLDLERLTWGPDEQLARDFFGEAGPVQAEGDPRLNLAQGTEFIVQPRARATLFFTAPTAEGEWEIGCMLPGHYESGMRGTLFVE